MKISVCVHLFYPDMLNSIISYLKNIKYEYKLYVTVVKGFYKKHHIEKIKSFRKDVIIIIIENKGVDIGGFLHTFKILDKKTDLVLKIHTKKGIGLPENPSNSVRRFGNDTAQLKGSKWYNDLMNGVLGNAEKVDNIINTFKSNKECGMVGYKLYKNYETNKNEIKKILPLFKLNESSFGHNFIGGTMFWVRYEILEKYFTDEVINNILNETKSGYVREPSIMHAVERIFGYIVYNEKQKILCL